MSDFSIRTTRLGSDLESWRNCYLGLVSYSASPEGEELRIEIEDCPVRQHSALILEVVRVLFIDKPDDIDLCFIDDIKVSLLPAGIREPFGAGYFEDRRDFVRITIKGPASIDVVCGGWRWNQ